MSFVGIQLHLPFAFGENGIERLYFSDESELAFILTEILKRKKDDKLVNLNKVFLPIVAIQGEPNHHLLFDNVGIAKLLHSIGNAPRQAQVGAIMRKSEIDLYERLKQAYDILSFKTTILDQSSDLTEEERQAGETREVMIPALYPPDVLEAFENIIPHRFEAKIIEENTLSSKYEYDALVNLSEKYRHLLSEITGYISRWLSTKKLIEEPIERWILEYNATVQDIKTRYRSERNKAESLIDEKSKNIQLDSIKTQMENWVFNAKKNIIGKMGGFFKPIEGTIEDMLQKNKEMLNIEVLQTKDPMEVLKAAYRNIASMRDAMTSLDEALSRTSSRLKAIQTDLENTELSAEERINKINQELNGKMETKNKILEELTQQERKEIGEWERKREQIEQIKMIIFKYIDERIALCNKELEYFRTWQIRDSKTRISNPFANMFVPAYLATIQDEDEDETIHLLMPCICGKDLQWKPITEGLKKYEELALKTLIKDMKIRTNFEFVSMKHNLLKEPGFKEKVKKGLLALQKQGYCSEEKKSAIIEKLEEL